MRVEQIEIAEIAAVGAQGRFQVMIGGGSFVTPEPQLRLMLHGGSPSNVSRIQDAELDGALDAAGAAEDDATRAVGYETVQRRLVELVPIVFHTRNPQGVMANGNVGGIRQYGGATLLADQLWIQR